MRHLLRIPEDFEIPDEPEDEFECLNLDITSPPLSANSSLPVLVWIHGTYLTALTSTLEHSRLTIIQAVPKSSPSAQEHPRSVVSMPLSRDSHLVSNY